MFVLVCFFLNCFGAYLEVLDEAFCRVRRGCPILQVIVYVLLGMSENALHGMFLRSSYPARCCSDKLFKVDDERLAVAMGQ